MGGCLGPPALPGTRPILRWGGAMALEPACLGAKVASMTMRWPEPLQCAETDDTGACLPEDAKVLPPEMRAGESALQGDEFPSPGQNHVWTKCLWRTSTLSPYTDLPKRTNSTKHMAGDGKLKIEKIVLAAAKQMQPRLF